MPKLIKPNSKKPNLTVIFFTPFPEENAATRYRILQFFPYLSEMGIECSYSSIMSRSLYRIKKRNGLWNVIKILLLIWGLLKRVLELFTIRQYDVVVLHREYFPFFTPLLERIVFKLNKNIIFDFDDAIYCRPTYNKNWRDFLRNPAMIGEICQISSCVMVGNEYLRLYASQFNNRVRVMPTVFDVSGVACLSNTSENKVPVIGWIGSWYTVYSLLSIQSALKELAKKYHFILKIVGEKNIYNVKIDGVNIKYELGVWNTAAICRSIKRFDIGIMPLIDTEWERGKCGFKLIQYMTLGVPAVASAVGTNKDIINDGINGFLADDTDAWVYKLSLLLQSKDLRRKIGEAGRKTVEREYSINKWAAELGNTIKFVYKNRTS